MTFQDLLAALRKFTITQRDTSHLTEEQLDDIKERKDAIDEAMVAGEFEQAAELARHLQVTFPLPKTAVAAELTRLLLAFSRWVAAAAAWDSREALADVFGTQLGAADVSTVPQHRALAGTAAMMLAQRKWGPSAAAWDQWVQQMWTIGPNDELARLRDWANALDAYAHAEKLEGATVPLAIALTPERLRSDVLTILRAADKALSEPRGAAALGIAALGSSAMQVPPGRRLSTGRTRTLH